MAVTLDATVKGASANSYLTRAAAQVLLDNRLNVVAWTAASNDQKDQALIMATQHLDDCVDWMGDRTTTTQALRFPRDGLETEDSDAWLDKDTIPAFLQLATAVQALFELGSDRTLDASRGIDQLGVGPINITFNRDASTQRLLADEVWEIVGPWAWNRPPRASGVSVARLTRTY